MYDIYNLMNGCMYQPYLFMYKKNTSGQPTTKKILLDNRLGCVYFSLSFDSNLSYLQVKHSDYIWFLDSQCLRAFNQGFPIVFTLESGNLLTYMKNINSCPLWSDRWKLHFSSGYCS